MHSKAAFQRCSIFTGILALAVVSCSGLSNVSNLFATDTPTPTSTFTPSPTVTPSPTAKPTETPSPSPTPIPTGSNVEEQPDGSTLFTDYDNQYQMAIPEDWIVVPLSSKDLAEILNSMSAKNPEIKAMAENLKNMDPDVMRVMAVSVDSKYMQDGASPSLSVMAIEDKVMSSMPMDYVTKALEASIKQQNVKVLSSGNPVVTNPNGVELGSFEYQRAIPSPLGTKIPVRYKAVFFRSGDKTILLQLGAPEQFADQFAPAVDQITDSIKVNEP